MVRVHPASPQDLIAIRALLERCGMPTGDLESSRPEFAIIRDMDEVIAAGALQRFGSSALLRSVVVAPNFRGSGLGQAIVIIQRSAAPTDMLASEQFRSLCPSSATCMAKILAAPA